MSNRSIATMDVMELVRLLRMGESDRAIAACLGHTRRSIARYRTWAQEQGLFEKEGLPSVAEVHRLLAATLPTAAPPQQTSTVARYGQEILAYRARGMEVAAIRGRLEEAHGRPVSYMAVWRFLQRQDPAPPAVFVRVETAPGSQAQVDFGYAGWTIDPASGKARKTWAFVLVLSWSRHCYAELVYDQRIATWLLCHRHAFEFWGGCPRTIVLDNLKAAILHASVHDPVVQRSYRECAEHYGFRIDPNPPRTPRLKGKVEQGGVHYVKRNFLAGRQGTERLDDLNQKLRTWIMTTAGERITGPRGSSRWSASEIPSGRPCWRCRRPRMTRRRGRNSVSTGIAISPSSAPTTRRRSDSLVRSCGCAAARAPSTSTVATTS